MKIAIYDTQHFEMTNVMFSIFDNKKNEILLLIDEILKSKLKDHPFTINKTAKFNFLTNASLSTNEFHSKCINTLLNFKPQLLILNTVDKNYRLVWKMMKKINCPVIITIHNINTWLSPPFTLNKTALANYYFRKKMVRKSSALIVQEELFINYIKENNLYKRPVFTVPHTLQEESVDDPINKKVRIDIPGGIDGFRRDYNLALDIISDIHQKSNRFQFVFLGKVAGNEGEKIWQRIILMQKNGMDIEHYYDPSSNKTFDREMKQCDLVFLPLNVFTRYEGIQEIYGKTKVTGVIYDMMRFAKPGLVPHHLQIPPTMKGSLLSYESAQDLVNQLMEFENNASKMSDLKRIAKANSLYYTEKAIRSRVLGFISQQFNLENNN